MTHRTSSRFWELYRGLPEPIRALADQKFELLQQNPRHPSVHLKKAGQFWSARIGLSYRALAVEISEGFLWIWIGNHEEYDRLLSG